MAGKFFRLDALTDHNDTVDKRRALKEKRKKEK